MRSEMSYFFALALLLGESPEKTRNAALSFRGDETGRLLTGVVGNVGVVAAFSVLRFFEAGSFFFFFFFVGGGGREGLKNT